jgi:hypothetical protein
MGFWGYLGCVSPSVIALVYYEEGLTNHIGGGS